MATEKKSPETHAAEPPVIGSGTAVYNQTGALWTTPIILRRDKKSKRGRKKKKYSRGTKGLQRLVLGFSESANRMARGFSRSSRSFADRSRNSSRKRRDGIVRDIFRNASRAFQKGSGQFSKAPEEIAKRFSTRRTWRAVRVWTPFTAR